MRLVSACHRLQQLQIAQPADPEEILGVGASPAGPAAMNQSQVEVDPYEYSYYDYTDEAGPTTRPKE